MDLYGGGEGGEGSGRGGEREQGKKNTKWYANPTTLAYLTNHSS